MIKLLWHGPSNMMALAHIRDGLPLLTICDDEYVGINPFYAYPLSFLNYYGWVDLGEF